MKQKINRSMILTQKLEGIGAGIFEPKYIDIIKKEIGKKHGVYALYDEKGKLYYVGRASNLARRVKQHLRDKHSRRWSHFSVYFTKKAQYVKDIEAIIISIAEPKANKIKPRLGKDKNLRIRIQKAMKKRMAEEYRKLGLTKTRKVIRKGRKLSKKTHKKSGQPPSLTNPFKKRKSLIAKYKGKTYRAIWLKSGNIKYENKIYSSPTTPAEAIVKRRQNGKTFWSVKDNKNNLIKLKELD